MAFFPCNNGQYDLTSYIRNNTFHIVIGAYPGSGWTPVYASYYNKSDNAMRNDGLCPWNPYTLNTYTWGEKNVTMQVRSYGFGANTSNSVILTSDHDVRYVTSHGVDGFYDSTTGQAVAEGTKLVKNRNYYYFLNQSAGGAADIEFVCMP